MACAQKRAKFGLGHPADGQRRRSKDDADLRKGNPQGYDVDPVHTLIIASRDLKGLPLDMLSFATFLYENEAETGPLLEIPEQFTSDQ